MTIRSLVALPLLAAGLLLATETRAQDPRVGLAENAQAASGMELVASLPKPDAFNLPPGIPAEAAILFANSDLAFRGDLVFVGNFFGFNVYDVSNPASPQLRTSLVCPGGQGDLSVHGDLLFMSVEMPNGMLNCETEFNFNPAPNPNRFRGVRIFDISDLDAPRQVAAIQTCRGSHTHTLVTDPDDDDHVYIYVSGASYVRPAEELAGCSGATPEEDPNTSLFRIEVIKVPVDHPEDAEVVNAPRIFANPETGAIAGLNPGGPQGPDAQESATTDQCHDITAYPELGIAGGACAGNGIILDISDPANPRRTAEVSDPNFAYWHSATFNNDASKVVFTDEWGGGTEARCRDTDPRNWGADAIFDREGLVLKSYFKLPAVQTPEENCVAHNGSLVPVPGRDIMVQAWYQGGMSVFDFTDSANPVEIAYFDRGPIDADTLALGGQWSAYWYNGNVYGSEIGRGLDVVQLVPSEHLSANEIEAAKLVRQDVFNPQTQTRIEWPADPAVARALLDQLVRMSPEHAGPIQTEFESAMALDGDAEAAALNALAGEVDQHLAMAPESAAARLQLLASTLRELAEEAD
jgi:hypothetical protein